jgi:DnaJ-class molecular chaperone
MEKEKNKTDEYLQFIPEKKPYLCPVCGGRGFVSVGFYQSVMSPCYWTSSIGTEPCRSCGGTGVIIC